MLEHTGERGAFTVRSGKILDRIELVYLRFLRAALLAVATILLIWAAGWGLLSLAKVLKSPESVVEKPSVVGPADIADTSSGTVTEQRRKEEASGLNAQQSYYDDFVKRYYKLFQAKYQPSLRSDDKKVSREEFDDLSIKSSQRMDAIREGRLDFAIDKADLEAFLPVVSQVSNSESTTKQLTKYRTAVKRATVKQVQRTRTETRRGWDSYSTDCTGWYESPVGCPVNRSVQVPYSQNVTVMQYPEGIRSPLEILKGYQDRYFNLLLQRRDANSAEAAIARADIVDGQVVGWAGLSKSMMLIGAFLVLMFFFLMVAIERHQRRLTYALKSGENNSVAMS